MKVALVHDYLIEYGGAERVLEALAEIFPDAPLYTAYFDLESLGPNKERFKNWLINSSWLQKIPFARKLVSPFRIFAPLIFEGFDLNEYDLVISSCNTYFSKASLTKPGSLHISYIHTPPRYLYGYTTSFNYKKHFWTKLLGEAMNHILRVYDFETSQRPDILVANSKNVQERIKKFYRRDSVVIYPPVDIEKFKNQISKVKNANQNSKEYFLSLGRLVRGKGVDIIVRAFDKIGLPLKVVGTGPELKNLKSSIFNPKSNIDFLGMVKDEDLRELYTNAKALVLASEDEDFGITAVEAFACGTPVIAVRTGGYLETVIEGKTGIFFDAPTPESLIKALEGFDKEEFKEEDLKDQAERFSKERFKKEILELVNSKK